MRPKSDAEKVNAEKVNLENVGTSSKLPAWKHFFDFFFWGIVTLWLFHIAMEAMALIEIDGLANLISWWIFPWQTVNVITRW